MNEVLFPELKTIVDFIRYGVSEANRCKIYFGHGTDNAIDDMFWLILTSLYLPTDCDPLLLQSHLTLYEKQHLFKQIQRRVVDRVPVPYLIEQANFCGLSFYVDNRVLIPRSPIAELIEKQFSPWIEEHQVARILDLCTGSGCIAIACCYAFPNAIVDAGDLSMDALEVATINQNRHEVGSQLQLHHSDVFEKVPKVDYDIIVSNPPYVGDIEMDSLPREYYHEPDLALRAKNNGLALVENILLNAHHYLSKHGILVVEVGNSAYALQEAFPDLPFTWLEFANCGQGVFLLTYAQLKEYYSG